MVECENIELTLAILLIISEMLPFIKNNDSCNGILNTLFCMLKISEECSNIDDASSVDTITLAVPVEGIEL